MCYSERAASTFIDAGVAHVVAVRANMKVTDAAARWFSRHFFHALFAGHTVQRAYDYARSMVQTSMDAGFVGQLQRHAMEKVEASDPLLSLPVTTTIHTTSPSGAATNKVATHTEVPPARRPTCNHLGDEASCPMCHERSPLPESVRIVCPVRCNRIRKTHDLIRMLCWWRCAIEINPGQVCSVASRFGSRSRHFPPHP